jgi:hypothetical protein
MLIPLPAFSVPTLASPRARISLRLNLQRSGGSQLRPEGPQALENSRSGSADARRKRRDQIYCSDTGWPVIHANRRKPNVRLCISAASTPAATLTDLLRCPSYPECSWSRPLLGPTRWTLPKILQEGRELNQQKRRFGSPEVAT